MRYDNSDSKNLSYFHFNVILLTWPANVTAKEKLLLQFIEGFLKQTKIFL